MEPSPHWRYSCMMVYGRLQGTAPLQEKGVVICTPSSVQAWQESPISRAAPDQLIQRKHT